MYEKIITGRTRLLGSRITSTHLLSKQSRWYDSRTTRVVRYLTFTSECTLRVRSLARDYPFD